MKVADWVIHAPDQRFHVLLELKTDTGVSGWGAAYSERGQVLGQIEADVRLAAFFAGGFPEQRLGRMGEAAGRQATRRQTDPRQDPIRVGSTGPQGVDHRAHQRHIVGQITRHFLGFLYVREARPS